MAPRLESAAALHVPSTPRLRPARSRPSLGFCSTCGEPLQPCLVEGNVLGSCWRCGQVAYRNPAVLAVTVLEDARRPRHLWLIRRAIEPFVGHWALPGGYVDASEHPQDAARRECAEEVRCDVQIESLIGVFNATYADSGVVVIAYAASTIGRPRPGAEVDEVKLFAAHARPRLAFDTHEAAVGQWQASS